MNTQTFLIVILISFAVILRPLAVILSTSAVILSTSAVILSTSAVILSLSKDLGDRAVREILRQAQDDRRDRLKADPSTGSG